MIIKFNKKIYSQPAIKRAIKNYQRLADFSFSPQKKYFLVKIKKAQPEIRKNIEDEFSNCVLSLTKG